MGGFWGSNIWKWFGQDAARDSAAALEEEEEEAAISAGERLPRTLEYVIYRAVKDTERGREEKKRQAASCSLFLTFILTYLPVGLYIR